MPHNPVFKHLAWLIALCPLLACQQMAPGGLSATGTPSDTTESSSKTDEGDPSLAPGVDGAPGPYGAAGGGGATGGGGSGGGAEDSSGSSSTVAARKLDPVSATADPAMVVCPPEMTPAECLEFMAMMGRMGTALSNDPRIDLAARDGSQFIRVVSWPDETAAQLGLTSNEAVMTSLRAGTLAPEAVHAANVQDVTVAVRPDGSFDLSPFLKSGLNLVFADTGAAGAVPPADLASTVKSERFSYLSYTSLLASEFNAIRLDEVKTLNLNEAR